MLYLLSNERSGSEAYKFGNVQHTDLNIDYEDCRDSGL